jgi:serine/threonine protein kinase
MKIEGMERELDILKKLSDNYGVALLGLYTQGKVLGWLLHPVVVYGLGVFVDELGEEQRQDVTKIEVGEGLNITEVGVGAEFPKLMDRLGLLPTANHVRERLNKVYGCLANAVQYLYNNDIRYKDLKPSNILLDMNDGLYVTGFGLSRDTTNASSSVTDVKGRGTYKHCAMEAAGCQPRGRAADVCSPYWSYRARVRVYFFSVLSWRSFFYPFPVDDLYLYRGIVRRTTPGTPFSVLRMPK